MSIQLEYDFTLPRGYIDREGTLHRNGMMRLATAADEIAPLRDPRVQQNPAYLNVLLLSRVIVRLGTLNQITPEVVESLSTRDFAFLNEMYEQINDAEAPMIEAVCPNCGCQHQVPMNFILQK